MKTRTIATLFLGAALLSAPLTADAQPTFPFFKQGTDGPSRSFDEHRGDFEHRKVHRNGRSDRSVTFQGRGYDRPAMPHQRRGDRVAQHRFDGDGPRHRQFDGDMRRPGPKRDDGPGRGDRPGNPFFLLGR